MRIAFVQTSPRLGLTSRNLDEAFPLIEKVQEADLVVLPELFHSGYAARDRDEALSHSVSADEMSEPLSMCLDACRKFRMNIVGGFLERDTNSKLYNSAWLIGPDGILAAYRKINLFNNEKNIFEPGVDIGPVVKVDVGSNTGIDTARVGMLVCFDWVFPEVWGRLAWGNGDGTGAQVIAHPANLVIPDACPLAIRTRAVENRVFIVTAGRVGTDPGLEGEIEFKAGSRIVAPDGAVLAEGPDDSPGCDMVVIDPALADNKFITPRNHVLRERFGVDDGGEPPGKQ